MLIILVNLLNFIVNFIIGLIVAGFLGPEGFGSFAIALGTGGLLQIFLFGWMKLAAARFYSEQAREARPGLRATLDRVLVLLGGGLLTLALSAALVSPAFNIPPALAFWALAFAAVNGAYEYRLALLRARFHDRGYAGLMILKNMLALALTAGLAYATGSAALTLAGTTLSLALAAFMLRRVLKDPAMRRTPIRRDVLRACLSYGFPVSTSLLLFALIPIANRVLGAQILGLAEAGQLALAQDIGLRLVLTIGLAMDALLFQLAVRADEHEGVAEGRAQIAQNMALMAAILLPALAGVWIVLPSFEVLIVPREFQGSFAQVLGLLLPGLACYAIMTFALAPAFQIAKRTWPVIAAAGCACLANGVLLAVLPRAWGLDMLALAQSGALLTGLCALLMLSPLARPQWPHLRDMIGIIAAVLVMIAATWPLRDLPAGIMTLSAQAGVGALVYALMVFAFDTAGLRRIALARLRRAGRSEIS